MFGYVAAAIGIAMVGKTVWMIDDWGRDLTQNDAEWSDASDDQSQRPLRLEASTEDVEAAIHQWVDGESKWAVVEATDQAAGPPMAIQQLGGQQSSGQQVGGQQANSLRRLHLTRTTPLFRFVDDIWVDVLPLDDSDSRSDSDSGTQVLVNARSQSRVGKGDLGQNPRNLKALRDGMLASGLRPVR
ncbi:Protein of unknown function [Neorhodopirellula lusitana]|uniref:DUF1499 domain-containing protein n=1 Tax=Neorhodopirellula lusitana TaxID=445327 RepID=A0ABY1PXI3_9BACT|nr:DUF1499 domain-containing protein [Neorhodopirellula lusitana]SMP50894.1 Protein of unknown function [Neorhodopirellula lusitana]